jgi:endonuclease VIII-like 1
MPEHSEVRIMSEFINKSAEGRTFKSTYKVERGNVPHLLSQSLFTISSRSVGKQIELTAGTDLYHVFMGMSGNWVMVPTEDWSNVRFTRLRFDSTDGMSLLLHGGYMGPKFSINKPFTGQKRGPDPIDELSLFRANVMSGINTRAFDKPLGEALLDQRYFNGVGAYLAAEIMGRLDVDPFLSPNKLGSEKVSEVIDMTIRCITESYAHGGGELIDWKSPLGGSTINEWLMFYGNKSTCVKQKFGTRNIWIASKWTSENKEAPE